MASLSKGLAFMHFACFFWFPAALDKRACMEHFSNLVMVPPNEWQSLSWLSKNIYNLYLVQLCFNWNTCSDFILYTCISIHVWFSGTITKVEHVVQNRAILCQRVAQKTRRDWRWRVEGLWVGLKQPCQKVVTGNGFVLDPKLKVTPIL